MGGRAVGGTRHKQHAGGDSMRKGPHTHIASTFVLRATPTAAPPPKHRPQGISTFGMMHGMHA